MTIKKQIKEIFYHLHNFGFSYTFSYVLSLLIKKRKYKTRKKAIKILEKNFGFIFENYKCFSDNNVNYTNIEKKFWLYWSQGINKIPYVTKEVIARIRKFYPECEVIIIDDNNINNYLHIDDNILKLYKQDKISIQTFSDIVRFNLLYKYGGVWVDSTLLFFERYPIFETIKDIGFYSLNVDCFEKNYIWKNVYPIKYTTFFLATCKGNQCMEACVNFYNCYYKKYNHAIDYFMNDYILILCMKYHLNNDCLNKIPFNAGNPFALVELIKNNSTNYSIIKNSPQKTNLRTTNEEKLKKILCEIDSNWRNI